MIKLLLASLLAVGLIGGSQVVASEQVCGKKRTPQAHECTETEEVGAKRERTRGEVEGIGCFGRNDCR